VLPLVVEPVVPEPSGVLVLPMEPVVDVPPMPSLVLLVLMLPVPLVLLSVPDEPRVRPVDDLLREERVVLFPVVRGPLAEVPDWPVEPGVPIWSPPMVELPTAPPEVVLPVRPDVPLV